ncbi:exosortase family protein XrtF [Bizionia saleffrena]|uniref:Exosortase family protein XrtF n=1 Tax=Bizionia saleffrena TaxID=291189 RepID=A0A8H2QK85_9FLAO|nr:exosortase family protein XrtF [Bizionia saleffrena]TYB77972.1 exosortase family protein XrtF [Bizionia saleffrena]
MKALLLKYKYVLQFILTFLMVYFVLSFSYKLYLDFSEGSPYYPDYLTYQVAEQIKGLLNGLGYNTVALPHPNEASIQLVINDQYVARIIEGCNSVSVIILFVSFVVAFSGTVKTTITYLFVGALVVYLVNLVRIVILSIGLYRYPEHSDFLHSVVFPALIYGIVFLLWMLWVNRFSNIRKRNKEDYQKTSDEL